ncbi:MAG: hypothetical protein KAH32_07590 [Chlamydiia bacterium]|nr:hypothetical protein [Chlamydiia bacterium]
MYVDNTPIKKGFVFFKSDLCTRDFSKAYPLEYQVSRRGGYGYFCKINPTDKVNGCTVITTNEYDLA